MYTLIYSSTRAEVWRWYWKAWAAPHGLWRFHALIVLAFPLVLWITGSATGDEPRVVLRGVVIWAVAAVTFMVAWPQIRFKPQPRTLRVDARGWSTVIGTRSGARTWHEVAAIDERPDAVVLVSANGNALIVPNRAFTDASERAAFLSDVRAWHRQAVRADGDSPAAGSR